MRKKITLNMTVHDIVMLMAEGNPGAITVMLQLLGDAEEGFHLLLHLDDMNIRGPQIWVGYKDHCKEDIEVFKLSIKNRDMGMCAVINRSMGKYEHLAVPNGASFSSRGGMRV